MRRVRFVLQSKLQIRFALQSKLRIRFHEEAPEGKHVGSWPRAFPLRGRLMVSLKVMPVGKGAAGENFEIFIGQSLSWTPTRQTAPPLTLRRSQRWAVTCYLRAANKPE